MIIEPFSIEYLPVFKEIYESQESFLEMERNQRILSEADLLEELELSNPSIQNYFIKLDDTYIGFIQWLTKHPKDEQPWLGLLIIHKDYEGYGFGTNAYFLFEKEYLLGNSTQIMLGILKKNTRGKRFWEGLGFTYLESRIHPKFGEILVYYRQLS